MDADYAAALSTRLPHPVLIEADTFPATATLTLDELEKISRDKTLDHSPFMPAPAAHTSAVLRGFASSGDAVNALFPSTAVRDPRKLLAHSTPFAQTLVPMSRMVDAAVVVVSQLVPFVEVDQAEVRGVGVGVGAAAMRLTVVPCVPWVMCAVAPGDCARVDCAVEAHRDCVW